MNAVEHIVECYFRYCKGCFTITDVKIRQGNNRQLDLLAYNILTHEQYHIESSVTHQQNWCPSTQELVDVFDTKFRGVPPKRSGTNTDHSKGKMYYEHITQTYRGFGFDIATVQRVFVTWTVRDPHNLDQMRENYCAQHGIDVQVWSFRDKVLPELTKKISTSNYEDEVLRTLSLLRQYELQKGQLK